MVAPITGTDNENQGERQGIKGKIKGKEKKSKGNMEQMSRREIWHTGTKRNWSEKHEGSTLAHGTCAKDTLYRLVWKYGLVWKSCGRVEPSLPPLGLGTRRGMEETSTQRFRTQTIDAGQFLVLRGSNVFVFFYNQKNFCSMHVWILGKIGFLVFLVFDSDQAEINRFLKMLWQLYMYACIHTSMLENEIWAECIHENTSRNMVQRGMLKLELKLLEHNFLWSDPHCLVFYWM